MTGGTSRWHAGSGQRGREFEAEVFRWDDSGPSWYFARVPLDVADELRLEARGGFGSVRVTATIGDSSWMTSVFPEKSAGGFLLPVKRTVRAAEGIDDGDIVAIRLDVGSPSNSQKSS
jgi:hypothetical protein